MSFSREVLPLLSDRCFHCHGPDPSHREAGLRLDDEQDAKADRGGYRAIAPGSLEQSEAWRRIVSADEYEVMPPPDSHRKPLSDAERRVLREWIRAGAPWGKHWSFEKLERPPLPSSGGEPASADVHPIDAFVNRKLAEAGLSLSDPAPPTTLVRRLSFDLTGMAPAPAEARAFAAAPSDDAWAAIVERTLASPHHAERLAMWWLDAARYSDSDGFQLDDTRQNWPWRDWVIEQFQQNRAFDDFTIEQFAGDLLPDATDEQILATCFHRNHMTNGEGGRDPEESRVDYVIDRVNTTGTVWLGLTLGCVQCHSHKFDPISQHDYYALTAFFNSIDEDGRAGMSADPYLEYTSKRVAAPLAALRTYIDECRQTERREFAAARARFEAWLAEFRRDLPADYRAWWTPPPTVSSVEGTRFVVEADQTVQTAGPTPRQDDYRVVVRIPDGMKNVTGWRVEVLPSASHVGGRYTRAGSGEFILTSVRALARSKNSPAEVEIEIAGAVADYERDPNGDSDSGPGRRYAKIAKTLNDDARDGWTTAGSDRIVPHTGVYEFAQPYATQPGDQLILVLRHRTNGSHANIGRFRIGLAGERGETVRRVDGGSPVLDLVTHESVAADSATLGAGLRERLLEQHLLGDAAYQRVAGRLRRAEAQLQELEEQSKPRRVMVLSEREKPRETHVLVRGVWDAKGDRVTPAVLPSVLGRPAEQTRSRLDLARWLVDPENPLTARVVANQLWQMMFGRGLVRTPEDFGLQGEMPTHPELLDWLAAELVESGWDLRRLLRLIATSETYKQSSATTADLLERDPENRLLARAPRFRLPAWMIRDNTLRASGLLNPTIGGPPVRPYQPEGVWSEITMGRFDYQPSIGPAQHRRTVYSFWRRSIAPTFLFDSAQRRVCEVGVRRTNTPLHALTLMNDETMLEASRVLADRAVAEQADGPIDQPLDTLARRVLSRPFDTLEQDRLRGVWTATRDYYLEHPESAIEYVTVGQQEPPAEARSAPTAAWMTVANLVLNLDEAITRE